VYDEATILAGKQGNWERIDLYNNIAAGNYPEWDFAVQLFPDDGTYMYKGYDLLIPTQVVPFGVCQPVRLGRLTINRNFNNFFAEPEAIAFAPSNVVDGVSFVPDPLLQWRLMSYDDTASHRHGSPNSYLLPVNRAIAPIDNNYRDGYMQPYIYEGDQTSTPNDIGGVAEPGPNATLEYTSPGEMAGQGPIGRYKPFFDFFGQTRSFWYSLDIYAQQHTVDAYRFELANVGDAAVVQRYIDQTLNKIDNCLARRVAYGIGATLSAVGSGPMGNSTSSMFSYLYTLDNNQTKSNVGLQVAVIANDTLLSTADVSAMMPLLSAQKVNLTIIGPHIGMLDTGVNATASYLIASSVFYDAVFIGSNTANNGSSDSSGSEGLTYTMASFIEQAYSHGKAVGALGASGMVFLNGLGISGQPGVYSGDAGAVTTQVLNALSGPVRFPQRFPTDDVASICG
jgi:catalase